MQTLEETPLRLAGVIRESIVDGPGIRMVVFAQGCPNHCKGCHNPETHDPAGGYDSTVGNLLREAKKNPLLKGLTLSGGDPFFQANGFAKLARAAHEAGYNIITYTGYTFEELLDGFEAHEGWEALLRETDILVDGKFVLEERSLSLQFRGSKNQRVIDVPASLKAGNAVEREWEEKYAL